MSNEHQMVKTRQGVLQSGIPKRTLPPQPTKARGLILKGVVTAVYVVDDPNHFQTGVSDGPVATYCDVMAYTNIAGMRWRFVPRCLVVQPSGSGMHRGRVWIPRAATMDVTGSPIDLNKATNPANLDGDHVVVKFFNDNLNEPFVDGVVPHPSADLGNEEKGAGHRTRLRLADGDPDFWKHHGSYFGVDDNGDFVVDTTFANDGLLEDDGKEKPPPTGGEGAHRYRLTQDAEHEVVLYDMATPSAPNEVARIVATKDAWEVRFQQGATLKTELKDANAKLTLGDGAISAVIAEALQTFWDSTVKPKFDASDAHVHSTGVGPSGPPAPQVSFPSFDTTAISSKLTFPDG